MQWLDITGHRKVTASCISSDDWTTVVKSQSSYDFSKTVLLNAQLFCESNVDPDDPPAPDYETRLAEAQFLVTGITWYEAALWCNALSDYLGLDPVYTLNGTPAKWEPYVARARGKHTLTEFEFSSKAKGVRLLTEKDRKEALAIRGFTAIKGIHEWGEDRKRAPFIFESVVSTGTEYVLCNSTFRLPWNSFRVVRG